MQTLTNSPTLFRTVAMTALALAMLASAAVPVGATDTEPPPGDATPPQDVNIVNSNVAYYSTGGTVLLEQLGGSLEFVLVENGSDAPVYIADLFLSSSIEMDLEIITTFVSPATSDSAFCPFGPGTSGLSLELPADEQVVLNLSSPIIVPPNSSMCAVLVPPPNAVGTDGLGYSLSGYTLSE